MTSLLRTVTPIPLISSAFSTLQKAQFFTKLDLCNAYHLVRIKEGDEWKTAFNTPRGHYEYLVMPFGLTNAPAVFQALVNDVLRETTTFLSTWMTFSFSQTPWKNMSLTVHLVLQRLLENRLFAKAVKCEFHRSTVQFLGFVVSRGKLEMDPSKTDAVGSWPTPINRKELQRFLWFANFYRRFIRGFSSIVLPLTTLTSTKVPFRWSSEAEAAFVALKARFSTAPILIMPNPEKQFILEVDASDTGAGAVLSQRSSDGKVCLLFSPSPSLRKKLRSWRSRVVGSQIGSQGMASPPRGFHGAISRLDGSQELGIPTHGQMSQPPTGSLVLVL